MTAQIIQFPGRAPTVSEWPSGQLGVEMERMAQLAHRAVLARGEYDTLDRARRRVLDAMQRIEQELAPSS